MQLGIMEIAMEPVLPVLNVKRKMVEQKVTVPVVLVFVAFSLRRHVVKKSIKIQLILGNNNAELTAQQPGYLGIGKLG